MISSKYDGCHFEFFKKNPNDDKVSSARFLKKKKTMPILQESIKKN